MDTFADLIQAVQDDLTIDSSSPLFNESLVKRAINRAYRRAGGLFRWPETEDAKKTSTQLNIEYYKYPNNWRPDSIWRLEVDGDQYGEDPDGSPLAFNDYLVWRADPDNANSDAKKWSQQWRRFFIYPVPTAVGSYNISVWGQKVVDALASNGDTTIFSYTQPECNEAVAMEAVAILRAKGEDLKTTQFINLEAKQILATAFDRIKKEQPKYEKNQPMFEVPDLFAPNRAKTADEIGQF